jgi:hypothetical protein
MNQDDKLIYENYMLVHEPELLLLDEGAKEAIIAFMASLGIMVSTGCQSVVKELIPRPSYPPKPGQPLETPDDYHDFYRWNIKPFLGSKDDDQDQSKVSCEPKSNVKKHPLYDYTHPWLKLSPENASTPIPDIAVQALKAHMKENQRFLSDKDGGPPSPFVYEKKYKEGQAFRIWHNKTLHYFYTVQQILPKILEDIKKKST